MECNCALVELRVPPPLVRQCEAHGPPIGVGREKNWPPSIPVISHRIISWQLYETLCSFSARVYCLLTIRFEYQTIELSDSNIIRLSDNQTIGKKEILNSDHQTLGISHCKTVRPLNYQTVKLSDYENIRLLDHHTIRLSDFQTFRLSDYRKIRL